MRSPSPQRSRFRRPLVLVFAGAAMIFAAAAGTAALTLQHSLAPGPFAAHLTRGLGRPITVESVALSLRPMPRVRMEGVVIEGLGTAGAAEVDVRIRPLLRGRVVARSMVFEDLFVTIRRDADGAFEPLIPPRPASGPFDWRAFPRMEVQRGELRLVQGENVSAVIGLQTLSLARFDPGLSAQLVLAGSVGGEDHDWSARPLRLRGRLVRHEDRFTFEDVLVRAEDAYVHWWTGRNLRGRFRYDDGLVEIQQLTLSAFAGRWDADGTVHLRGGTRLDLDVALDAVSVAALFRAAQPDSALADLGRLDTDWRLRIPWERGPRFERGVGFGQLVVKGGTLPTTSLFQELSRGLRFSPGPRQTTPVESLSAPVALRGGRVHSDAARLVTADYTLDARGSVGLDRSLDLAGNLHLPGLPAVPVTIAGALPRPDLQTHVGRIPRNGIDAMAQALRSTGRRLRDTLFGDDRSELAEARED